MQGQEARDTKFVRDREIPAEIQLAVHQMIQGLDGSGTENLRKDVEKVLVAAEREELEKAEGLVRIFKQGRLAALLNGAVNKGTEVQSSINANLTTSRLVQFGALSQAQRGGITTWQWNAQLDSRTCPVCRGLHGKRFKVQSSLNDLRSILGSQDVGTARVLNPWQSASIGNVNRLAGLSAGDLQSKELVKPPIHPKCRCVVSIVGTVPPRQIIGFQVRDPRRRAAPRPPPEPEPVAPTPVVAEDFKAAGGIFNEVDASEELVKAWNKVFKPGMKPKAVTDGLLQGTGVKYRGGGRGGQLAVTGADFSSGNFHVSIRATLMKDQKVFGEMARSFIQSPDRGLFVRHSLLALQTEAQGSGFAKKFLQNSMKLYREMGVKFVTLDANISMGSYAWARFGFTPSAEGWKDVVRSVSAKLRVMKQAQDLKLSPATEKILEKALASKDPKAIWKIADLRETVTAGGPKDPIGRRLLQGLDWEGRLHLDDAAAMKRFDAYAGRKK